MNRMIAGFGLALLMISFIACEGGAQDGQATADASGDSSTASGSTGAPASHGADLAELPPLESKVFELGPLKIDQIFTSMAGPSKRMHFDYTEMDWITGFRTEVVDVATGEPMGDEFFCHSQLQLDNAVRLVVNATGIADLKFPDGFGLPLTQIMRGVPQAWRGVFLMGMVLNNHDEEIDRDVLVRTTIDYMNFDEDGPPASLKKLYKEDLAMMIEPDPDQVSEHAGHENMDHGQQDGDIVEGMAVHWIVAPGEQVTKRKFTNIVQVDGRVHFGVVHLHNYGVYMKLTDLETGEELWRTDAIYEDGRDQITEIPPYSSAEGFPVFAGREYEIEALYNNTTDEAVDAMAMMYIFFHPEGNQNITYPEPPPGRVTVD
jgi:hypothetical protein